MLSMAFWASPSFTISMAAPLVSGSSAQGSDVTTTSGFGAPIAAEVRLLSFRPLNHVTGLPATGSFRIYIGENRINRLNQPKVPRECPFRSEAVGSSMNLTDFTPTVSGSSLMSKKLYSISQVSTLRMDVS